MELKPDQDIRVDCDKANEPMLHMPEAALLEPSLNENDENNDDQDSTDEDGNNSDGSNAINQYRLHNNPAKSQKRKVLTQNAEHIAFMSWVSSANRETSPLALGSEDHVQTPKANLESLMESPTRIISTPREYQLDLFERAKQENSIIVLDTGSGKTLIAVLLLRHTLDLELDRRAQGQSKQVAFFLVDKVALCMQQHRVLCANLEHPVGKFHGDKAVMGKQEEWEAQIRDNMAIVCTAQILLDLLGSGVITMSQINLLIFDEAHHTKKNHPYASIVRDHYIRMRTGRPRIMGMTASPVDSKTRDFQAAAHELETTLCSKIATVSDEVLQKGMEDRHQIEHHVYYGPLVGPEASSTTLYQTISDLFASRPGFRNHIDAVQDAAVVIGSWSAEWYWSCLLKVRKQALIMSGLDKVTEAHLSSHIDTYYDPNDQLDDDIVTLKAQQMMSDHLQKQPTVNKNQNSGFSLKFQALYDILIDEFGTNRTKRAIVFVQKRYIAYLLSEAFKKSDMRIPNMYPGYVVGSQPSSSSIVNMSIKDQINALDRFRGGQINCIFATQVAEEGIDVPDCDLIIRFDLYDSAIQYIQSKGRARQINSTYITMFENGNVNHIRKWKQATRDVSTLRRFCANLPSDRKVDMADESRLESEAKAQIAYEIPGTNARLTFHSSRQVLAKFASSVCNTADAHPEYVVIPTSSGKFIATAILPNASPLKTFPGTPQRSKLLARGSAAYRACIQLYTLKYLDGKLQSTLTKLLPKMRNARLAISANKRSEYNMIIKPIIRHNPATPQSQLFASVLWIAGMGPTGRPYRPLCLLTRYMLPKIEPIKLHIGDGIQSVVEPRQCTKPRLVSQSELGLLAKFTLSIFRDVFSKDYECHPGSFPYLLGPCLPETSKSDLQKGTHDPIDWDLLHYMGGTEAEAPRELENQFVIDPWDGSRKFITGKINKNYRAHDPVPKDVPIPKSRSYLRVEQNIAEYSNSLTLPSRQRMNWDPEQPVFDAELLPLRRNLLCEPVNGESNSCSSCVIILEPLVVSKIPVDIVIAALALPVILYRIESTSIAMDACQLLDLAIDPPLALEALTKGDDNTDIQESKNYERLEFLGDAFLKMATTISLFTLIPHNNEFEYHVERMTLVCNQNLFNHAVDRKLQEYVRSKGFDRRTWYPNMKLLKGKDAKQKACHSLADKSIADVCEALIGAAYLTEPDGQMDLAVKAVTKMVRSKNHTMIKYSEYYERYTRPAWQAVSPRAVERVAADRIESSMGYRFNFPRLLRSAFKHPSYPYEPDLPSYQRLEFLGDALLDVAIIDYLFQQFPNTDPQWLTEHKMAMASNHFFACLCVELGLHRYILTTNSSMTGHITAFVERIKEAKVRSIGLDGITPRADFWLDVEHPPKALSDIVEAFVGAMYEDSKYNYNTVTNFFNKFIKPYFINMSLYDTYAAGHPVTLLTKLMQDKFCCRSWRLCMSSVPCNSDTGASAITESNVICAMMIHGRKAAHSIRPSGKDAKVDVATSMLKRIQDLNRKEFKVMMECDCGGFEGDSL